MTRFLLALILLAGVAVRAVYLHEYRGANPYFSVQVADCAYYDDWADQIATGAGSSPTAFYQPPLYPHFLAAIYKVADLGGLHGERHLVVYVLQLLLGVLNLYLVFSIGRRIGGDAVGLIAATLVLLHANVLFWEVKLLATTLEITLSLIGVRCLLDAKSSRALFVAGVVVGLLAIARADKLPFAGLAALWIVASRDRGWRDRLRSAAWFVAPVAMIVGLVFARNVVVAHDPVLISANGGINFYFGNHAGASGINMAPSAEFGSLQEQSAEARRQAERSEGRSLTDAGVSSYWFGRGLEFIRTRPALWWELFRRKAELSVGDLEADIGWSAESEAFYAPVLGYLFLPFGLFLGLGVGGLLLGVRRRPQLWLLLLFVLTNYLVLLLFFMGSRFRVSAVPFLAIAAGVALVEIVRRLRAREWGMPIVTIVIAFGIAWHAREVRAGHTTPGHPRPMADRLYGNTTQMIGQAHAEIGEVLRARDAFLRVLERDPDASKAWYGLGRVAQHRIGFLAGPENRERRERLLDEAIDAYRNAIRLTGNFAEGEFRLGEVYRVARPPRYAEAADAFGEAVRLEPSNVDFRIALVEVLIDAGQRLEAQQQLTELDAISSQHPKSRELRLRLEQ